MKIEGVFGDFPNLETDRLLLRQLTLEDTEDLFEYASDPVVSRFVPWPTHESVEDTKEFIALKLKCYESGKLAPWGIVLKEENKLIGTIDFVHWFPQHARAEIGYVLSNRYWGQGYTPEAAKRVLQFGFEKMELNRIEAPVIVENIQSQRVLQKVGMTFEGVSREQFYIKGRFVDLAQYAILREGYEKSGSH